MNTDDERKSKLEEISLLRLYAYKNKHETPKTAKIMHKIANKLERELENVGSR